MYCYCNVEQRAYPESRPTSGVLINLTQVKLLGEQWPSSTLIDFSNTLSQNTSNANVGSLTGNRMFYNNDYMVRIGE